MQVYLAKPGGQKQGPFTLEQVRRDLAARKYNDADYWAWHDGLAEWKPLYDIPGISIKPSSTTSASTAIAIPSEPEIAPVGETSATASGSPAASTPAIEVSTPAPASKPSVEPSKISSGKPFVSLAQVFVLTTGTDPNVFKSDAIASMLQQTVGATLDEIRRQAPVDIIIKAKSSAMQALCSGVVPDSVWRALSAIKPEISKQAFDGDFHLCLRTFPSETDEVIALLAFYRNPRS